MQQELNDLAAEPPEWDSTENDRADELRRRIADAVFVVSPFDDVVHGPS